MGGGRVGGEGVELRRPVAGMGGDGTVVFDGAGEKVGRCSLAAKGRGLDG